MQYGKKSVGGPEHVPPGWNEWIALVGLLIGNKLVYYILCPYTRFLPYPIFMTILTRYLCLDECLFVLLFTYITLSMD